jgi:hypothetical protein
MVGGMFPQARILLQRVGLRKYSNESFVTQAPRERTKVRIFYRIGSVIGQRAHPEVSSEDSLLISVF